MHKGFILSFLSILLLLSVPAASHAGKVTILSKLSKNKISPASVLRNNNDLKPEKIDDPLGEAQANANETDENDVFISYQQLTYSHMPDDRKLEGIGFSNIPLLTTWFFFPPGHDKEEVDEEVRERVLHNAETRLEDGKDYVLDIEHWSTGAWETSETRAESVRKMIEIIDLIKSVHPNIRLGYYSMVPGRNYWDVYENCAWSEARHELCLAIEQRWHDANTELLPLAQKVDFILPSVYTFYNDPEGWAHYAMANIEEAQRLAGLAGGKPIFAYIWPRYHGSAPNGLPYTPIDGAFWRMQLEIVHQTGVNGIVIWDHAPWRTFEQVINEEEWWNQTMQFINEISPRSPLSSIAGN